MRRPSGKSFSILLSLFLLSGSNIFLFEISSESNGLEDVSLSGVVNIEDIAGTRIIGPIIEPDGAQIGRSFSIIKTDIGYNIEINTGGKKYTIEGNGERFPPLIDLEKDSRQKSSISTTHPNKVGGIDIDGNGFPDKVGVIGNMLQIEFDYEQNGRICNISETDHKDRLGHHLEVNDLDLDGKHDIIIGASEADGLNNLRQNCGEIHVIMGKNNRSFPFETNIDTVSDYVLEGNSIKGDGHKRYVGDKIGRNFLISDLEGDGIKELIVMNYIGTRVGFDERTWLNCGWIDFFDIPPLLSNGKGHIILDHPSSKLSIIGTDEGDCFGSAVFLVDFDSDGFKDLIITAPYADGIENLRVKCGEIFVLYGSGYRFKDLKVKGPAVVDSKVFCRSGKSNWNISFLDTNKENNIERVEMELKQDSSRMIFSTDEKGSMLINGDKKDVKILSSGFHHNGSGIGYCEMDIYFNWSIPFKGKTDVKVTLIDDKGDKIYSILEDRIDFRKDLRLAGTPIVIADGIPIEETGGHALPGDELVVSGFQVIYNGFPERTPDPSSVRIALMDDEEVRDSFLNGDDPILKTITRNVDIEELHIALDLPNHLLPGNIPPDLGNDLDVSIPIDKESPSKPEMITHDMDLEDFNEKSYNLTMDWKDELGKNGDQGESGVKYYNLDCGEYHEGPVMEEGGLFATCYQDMGFTNEEYTYIEERFDLRWDEWGPEPSKIHPNDYSVRWHGWLMQERTGNIRMVLEGKGEIKVILGGERVLNWTDLETRPIFGGYEVREKEFVPIEIYYRYGGDESRISIKMEDPFGRYEFLGSEGVYHPSSSFFHGGIDDSEIRTSLHAFDWTGRVSETWGYREEIDRNPPEFQTDNPLWFGVKDIVVNATVHDIPSNGTDPGGIDIKSIQFRIFGEDMRPSNDWTRKGLKVSAGTGNMSANLSAEVSGRNGWNGFVKFRATDLNMNTGESEMIPIGFDMEPPAIKIMSPVNRDKVMEGDLSISVKAHDIGGSGVDPDSVRIRKRVNDDEWGNWMEMESHYDNGEVYGSFSLSTYPSDLELQARCLDRVNNEGISEIVTVDVKNRPDNQPPQPVISDPLNGSFHFASDMVRLDATGTSDDGLGEFDDIHLTWHSNLSGIISTRSVEEVKLQMGYHRITFYADDGSPGHNISTYVDIIVGMEKEGPAGFPDEYDPYMEPETGDDLLWFIIVLVVTTVLTFLGIGILIFHRKRSDEELKVEIKNG